MVETREREIVNVTGDSGPSTAMVILFSLLTVAVLGFMVYFFSNNDLRTNNPTTIIDRETNTNTTTPFPVPSAPAPSVDLPSLPAPSHVDVTPNATPAPSNP